MAKTFAEYVEKVQRLVKEKSLQTSQTDVVSALENAADTLTQYRMGKKVVEVTADGSRLYALPSTFDRELAGYRIEYPVDDAANDVSYLENASTDLYDTPDGVRLRFRIKDNQFDYCPPTGEKFRIHFDVAYALAEDNVTVPDSLFGTVTKLAARELCLIMSTRYAQQAAGNVDGDSADYQNKSDKFLACAKEFMADFMRKVRPAPEASVGKFACGSFNTDATHRAATNTYPRDSSLRLN